MHTHQVLFLSGIANNQCRMQIPSFHTLTLFFSVLNFQDSSVKEGVAKHLSGDKLDAILNMAGRTSIWELNL